METVTTEEESEIVLVSCKKCNCHTDSEPGYRVEKCKECGEKFQLYRGVRDWQPKACFDCLNEYIKEFIENNEE